MNVVLCGIVSVSMSVCRSCRYASCVSCFVVWMFSRLTESPKRFLASFSIVVIMVGVSCFALMSFMIIDSKMRIFSASFPSSFCLFLWGFLVSFLLLGSSFNVLGWLLPCGLCGVLCCWLVFCCDGDVCGVVCGGVFGGCGDGFGDCCDGFGDCCAVCWCCGVVF